MVGTPVATPVTTPVPAPTVASVVLLLLHVPPVTASFKVIVAPVQTDAEPTTVIARGVGLTVIVVAAKQPVGIM